MINHVSSKIIYWEIAGVFFLIIAGTILHFTFEWLSSNIVVGAVTPVNESVWEHLKMGYFALIIFSTIEYFFIGSMVQNFWAAKAVGILALMLCIVVPFYTYTTFTSHSILFIDISLYIIGSILCQYISFKAITMNKLSSSVHLWGTAFLILLGFCFILFTYSPPRLHLFMDSNNGKYGIFKR